MKKDITAADFQHPLDNNARSMLLRVPFAEKILGTTLKYTWERVRIMKLHGNALEVTPDQMPDLYRMLEECCTTLNMPVPRLYVTNDRDTNANAFGDKDPSVVLTSGLLEALHQDEIKYILGHELGHIKCQHTVTRWTAYWIHDLIQHLTKTTPIAPFVWPLFAHGVLEWTRKGEYSCDRAGALCVQDRDTALSAMMKLAGGFSAYSNLDAWIQQAERYEKLFTEGDALNRGINYTIHVLTGMNRTHPILVRRAKALCDWFDSDQYRRLTA